MKGYCFIDMHIHSMFSNEEGVTQTPKNILNATLELIEDYKAKTILVRRPGYYTLRQVLP